MALDCWSGTNSLWFTALRVCTV